MIIEAKKRKKTVVDRECYFKASGSDNGMKITVIRATVGKYN